MDLSKTSLLAQVARVEKLDGHMTFRISRLAKLLEIEGAARLAGSGVNLTGYRMLLVIEIFGEISVSDLSKVMVFDRAQISRAATDLIDRGLLEARADPESRRKKLLALTDAGRATYLGLRELFDRRQEDLEGLLEGDELAGLWAAVEKISAYLEGRLAG